MHYRPEDFSKNGENVITVVQGNLENVGQRVKFSEIDKIEVEKYYGCKGGAKNRIISNGRRSLKRTGAGKYFS